MQPRFASAESESEGAYLDVCVHSAARLLENAASEVKLGATHTDADADVACLRLGGRRGRWDASDRHAALAGEAVEVWCK